MINNPEGMSENSPVRSAGIPVREFIINYPEGMSENSPVRIAGIPVGG
jgi:ABC-type transporter Mla subunit MlaD